MNWTAGPCALAEQTLEIRRGRRLVVGGPWPCADASVIFDAASGDYWVVGRSASALAQRLAAAAASDGAAQVWVSPQVLQDGLDGPEDLKATARNLVECGIAQWRDATDAAATLPLPDVL